MQKSLGNGIVIGFAVVVSISSVLWCLAQTAAKPLVFDTAQNGAMSGFGKGWRLKIHREPSLTAPLVRLPTSSGYTYDLMRAITRKPGLVEALRDLDVDGVDSKKRSISVHVNKGEQFESSDSAMLLAHDGSDCVARIHGITFYPNCLWLSGFNPSLRKTKFKFIQQPGNTEVWYRIVDSSGNVIGWTLQDWQFQAD
jgi:hypothetical protein